MLGSEVHPANGFVEPLEAAGIAPRNDYEILVALIALAAGEPDLVGEFLARDHVCHVFVIMRPFREQLVLNMDAGNAGAE